MNIVINIIIIILFLIYLLWTWDNTKGFKNNLLRISYIIIGTIVISLLTYIIYLISKNGVQYQNENILREVRNIILKIFIPINGFISMPRIGFLICRIKDDDIESKELKKKIMIYSIAFIAVIIFECFYFKNIQNGIINIINSK